VATRAYEVLGFVSVEGDEVVKLYVDTAARGQGVAGALLRQGEAVLAEDGIAHAVLYCTLGNTRAERFYRREGWVVDKVIADPVWLPDTRMEAPVLETLCFGKALG
ncbi:MAG: GNAT family N-acetyltransferase, partial [Pseudomonadota bacterium]